MELLNIGKIVDSFGLDGTVKVLSSTSFVEQRFKEGTSIRLFNKNNELDSIITVISCRKQQDILVVKFKEITTKEEALAKKNYILKAEKDLSIIGKNMYYYTDLEGCDVVDKDNKKLGKVFRVEEFPAQVTLRVLKEDNKTFFVPYVKEFIRKVDIDNKIIEINVIEGLL